MRSRSAEAVDRVRAKRLAAMSPTERVALAARLGEEGLARHMASHDVDRRTAVAQIQAARRLGRRPSSAATADEY